MATFKILWLKPPTQLLKQPPNTFITRRRNEKTKTPFQRCTQDVLNHHHPLSYTMGVPPPTAPVGDFPTKQEGSTKQNFFHPTYENDIVIHSPLDLPLFSSTPPRSIKGALDGTFVGPKVLPCSLTFDGCCINARCHFHIYYFENALLKEI